MTKFSERYQPFKHKRYYWNSCLFWIKWCRCNHPQAPKPGHSLCIGRKNCTSCYKRLD